MTSAVSKPFRLAWFSPLADRLKSSYLTRQMLQCAAKSSGYGRRWNVDVYTGDRDISEAEATRSLGFTVNHALTAYRQHKAQPYDFFVYVLEDDPHALFVRQAIPLWPGLVLPLDLNLSRVDIDRFPLVPEDKKLVRTRDEEESFLATINLGHDLIPFIAYALAPHFLPARDVLSAAKRLQDTAFPVALPSESETKELRSSERASRGIADANRHLVLIGEDPFEDGCDTLKAALKKLPPDIRNTIRITQLSLRHRLPVALAKWKLDDQDSAVATLVERESLHTWTDISALMASADIALSLRFDTLRLVPLELLLAFAHGIPSIISDFGPAAEMPNGIALRVPPGHGAPAGIAVAIEQLCREKTVSEAIGAHARGYIAEVCEPTGVWEDLTGFLTANEKELKDNVSRKEREYSAHRAALVEGMAKLGSTFGLSSPERI